MNYDYCYKIIIKLNLTNMKIFQENMEPPTPSVYNMTQCCLASGLLPQCIPLCSYDLRMSDMQALGATCQAQMGN